jgi:hypothetical protein
MNVSVAGPSPNGVVYLAASKSRAIAKTITSRSELCSNRMTAWFTQKPTNF